MNKTLELDCAKEQNIYGGYVLVRNIQIFNNQTYFHLQPEKNDLEFLYKKYGEMNGRVHISHLDGGRLMGRGFIPNLKMNSTHIMNTYYLLIG